MGGVLPASAGQLAKGHGFNIGQSMEAGQLVDFSHTQAVEMKAVVD